MPGRVVRHRGSWGLRGVRRGDGGAANNTCGAEYTRASGVDARAEGGGVAGEHELEDLGRRARVLVDLHARGGVEDREPGVDVPLVRVDAEHDVDFDGLDPAHVEPVLPGVGHRAVPGGAHAEAWMHSEC